MNILERLTKIETQIDSLVNSVQELKEKIDIMTPDVGVCQVKCVGFVKLSV